MRPYDNFAEDARPTTRESFADAARAVLAAGTFRHVPRKCGCCWLDFFGPACVGASGVVGGHQRQVYRRRQRLRRSAHRQARLRALQLAQRSPQRGGPR